MISEELKENIKRHYGNTDEDLEDLAAVMDSLADLDKLEDIKARLETVTLESEKKLKDLDETWRNRYRERFFDGDVMTPELEDVTETDEEQPEDISIEEYLENITKKEK